MSNVKQWVEACAADEIDEEDVIRFDLGGGPSPSTGSRATPTTRPTGSARTSRSISRMAW